MAAAVASRPLTHSTASASTSLSAHSSPLFSPALSSAGSSQTSHSESPVSLQSGAPSSKQTIGQQSSTATEQGLKNPQQTRPTPPALVLHAEGVTRSTPARAQHSEPPSPPAAWQVEFRGFVKYIRWPSKHRQQTPQISEEHAEGVFHSTDDKNRIIDGTQTLTRHSARLQRNSSTSSMLSPRTPSSRTSLSSQEDLDLSTASALDYVHISTPPRRASSSAATDSSARSFTSKCKRAASLRLKRKPIFNFPYSPADSDSSHSTSAPPTTPSEQSSQATGKLKRAFSVLASSAKRSTTDLTIKTDLPPPPPVPHLPQDLAQTTHRRSLSANVINPKTFSRGPVRASAPTHVPITNIAPFQPSLSPLPSPLSPLTLNMPATFVVPDTPSPPADLQRRPSHRRWTLNIAEADNVDDHVLLAELERLKQLGGPTDVGGEQRWGMARMALLCSREVIRTEKSYLRHLRKLQSTESAAMPELLMAHLPHLISSSELFSSKMDEDPSAYGVSVAFLAAEDVIEQAMVEWSKVVGDVMVSFLGSNAMGETSGESASAGSSRKWKLSISRNGSKDSIHRHQSLPNTPANSVRGSRRVNSDVAFPVGPNSRRGKTLSVQDIAIQPTQRVVQYVLLYQDLLSHTPQTSPSRALVERALSGAVRIARRCDSVQNNPALSAIPPTAAPRRHTD